MGIQRVREDKYAYITDSSLLEIETNGECHIRLINEKFYNTGFALAVPKNWAYKSQFDML